MSTATQQLPTMDHSVNSSGYTQSSPPESPLPSSPEDVAHSASSSTSSVDQLPPAFSAEGTTPAPCHTHADMVSHHSEIVVVDEDSFDDIHHAPPPAFSEISRPSSPTPPHTTSTTLTVNPHPLSLSFTAAGLLASGPNSGTDEDEREADQNIRAVALAEEEAAAVVAYENRQEATDLEPESPTHENIHFTPTFSSSTTSFFTAPKPHANHQISRTEHHHMSSPFSFFANSSLAHGDHQNPPHVKTLRIEMEKNQVVLMTGSTTKLEGTLYMNLKHNTKVKSLQLEFSGRSSVTWVDDNSYSPATRHTTAPHIEHTWSLISHQHKQPPTQLLAGQHAYPFSLELPDSLPESLATTHGKVAYRLTAILIKSGLTFNSSSVTAPIQILRRHSAHGAGSRQYQRGGRAVNGPEDKIKYKITLPQVRVPHSTKVPLQVSITSPNHVTNVNVLQVGLWERVVYRAEGRRRVDMRLVKIQKSEGWPHVDRHGNTLQNDSVTWNKVLLFDMPPLGNEMNQCNPSADNGLMKVNHLLRFTILGGDTVTNKRFRVENEVELKVLACEDQATITSEDEENNGIDGNGLPSYLTSFTTPRVSLDSEREILDRSLNRLNDDDDLLRAMLAARIHLPTYAESEEETNSRNASRSASRTASPERSSVSSAVDRTRSTSSRSSSNSIGSSSNSTGSSSSSLVESVAIPALPENAVAAPPAMAAGSVVAGHGQSRLQSHVRSLSNSTHQVHAPTPLRA